jgi:hypothetical protein
MVPQSQPRPWVYVQVAVIACGLLAACPSNAMVERPPPSAACRAWSSHITELIDQHRRARELDDDQLGDIIQRFYEAQHTCGALRFEEGLALYESIPIGSVMSRPLR